MTTTRAPLEHPTRPAGHPVRRFVIVIAALAIGAVLLWWSGVANPRLSVSSPGGQLNWGTGLGVVDGTLRNDALTEVEVTEARLEASGMDSLEITGDGRPLVGSTLGGGHEVTLAVHYRVDGCVPTIDVPTARLVITARTASGLERTVRLPFATAVSIARCL